MRVSPECTELPKPMQGAWHVDAHVGPMPSLLSPADLVAAVFEFRATRLTLGDCVKTAFGRFYVDDLRVDPSGSHVLLRTWAPGLVARFAITVHETSQGSFQAVLHNSVHPSSWIGRVYFRLIEFGHHVVMEIALRRLGARARNATPGSAKERATHTRHGSPGWESWRIMPAVFRAHVRLYRLLRGRLVGKNILLLTTTGRKSGRRRSTPLYFARDGEAYVIIASNGGEDRYPGWWYNVKAKPDVEIQVGRERIRCVAAVANEADAPALFAKLSALYGGYRRYREQTRRELTIFRIEPRAHG